MATHVKNSNTAVGEELLITQAHHVQLPGALWAKPFKGSSSTQVEAAKFGASKKLQYIYIKVFKLSPVVVENAVLVVLTCRHC